MRWWGGDMKVSSISHYKQDIKTGSSRQKMMRNVLKVSWNDNINYDKTDSWGHEQQRETEIAVSVHIVHPMSNKLGMTKTQTNTKFQSH